MAFSALDSKVTGPLFTPDAMASVFSDEARLAAMLRVEWALAEAQQRHKVIPQGLAAALAAITPARFDLEALGQATALSGVPTIPFVAALRALVPKDCEAFLHTSATTQDILDSALVLQMQAGMALIGTDLRRVCAGLAALAEREAETPCVGRTYGQHAAPVSFGYKVAVWLAGLCDVMEALPSVRAQAFKASLAGPVGTLSGRSERDAAVGHSFADLLGLGYDPLPWHVRRTGPVALACWLGQLIGALAKMAEDVVFLASTEVAEVAEPFIKGRGGSSAMPHKRNPVSATVILAAHRQAPALVAMQMAAMNAAHERPAGAWHGEWAVLPQLFGLAAGALAEAVRLAEGLEVDRARMQHNLGQTRGLIFADAVAVLLARHIGAGAAHHLVAEAADTVRGTGETLQAVLPRLAAWPQAVDAATLGACFDDGPAVGAAAALVPLATARARQMMTDHLI
jgi:3-carboxy-cis,cis-muconate cycloisomerase